jgi:hypothetical protein
MAAMPATIWSRAGLRGRGADGRSLLCGVGIRAVALVAPHPAHPPPANHAERSAPLQRHCDRLAYSAKVIHDRGWCCQPNANSSPLGRVAALMR